MLYENRNGSILRAFFIVKIRVHRRISPHGDYDYMGEAINLVNNFKVEKVNFNCDEFNDLKNKLIIVLDKKKILIILVLKNLV